MPGSLAAALHWSMSNEYLYKYSVLVFCKLWGRNGVPALQGWAIRAVSAQGEEGDWHVAIRSMAPRSREGGLDLIGQNWPGKSVVADVDTDSGLPG